MLHKFTDKNFKKEVLRAKEIVLVDFYAAWCGPCKATAPIIDELAKEYKKNKLVKIGKLNIEENEKTPSEFGIMSIPSILIFVQGKVAGQLVGIQTKAKLKKKIEALLP